MQPLWIGTWQTRKAVPAWWFESLLRGVSSRFPLASHGAHLALGPHPVRLSVLPDVRQRLAAELDSSTEAKRSCIAHCGAAPPAVLAFRETFCTCVAWGASLTSGMRNVVSCLGRPEPPHSSCFQGVFCYHPGSSLMGASPSPCLFQLLIPRTSLGSWPPPCIFMQWSISLVFIFTLCFDHHQERFFTFKHSNNLE